MIRPYIRHDSEKSTQFGNSSVDHKVYPKEINFHTKIRMSLSHGKKTLLTILSGGYKEKNLKFVNKQAQELVLVKKHVVLVKNNKKISRGKMTGPSSLCRAFKF